MLIKDDYFYFFVYRALVTWFQQTDLLKLYKCSRTF